MNSLTIVVGTGSSAQDSVGEPAINDCMSAKEHSSKVESDDEGGDLYVGGVDIAIVLRRSITLSVKNVASTSAVRVVLGSDDDFVFISVAMELHSHRGDIA